jgi:hypothetical protein
MTDEELYNKKLELSAYYTHGDYDNAKNMVEGSYKDLAVLKLKFSSSSVYGAIVISINTIYKNIVNYYGVVSHSFNVDDIDNTKDWKIFEKNIQSKKERKEHDDVLGTHVQQELLKQLDPQFMEDFIKLIEINDNIGVSHLLQKTCQDGLGFGQIKSTAIFNLTTSLDMELNSISSKKVTDEELPSNQAKKKKLETIEKLDKESDDPLAGKNVTLLLDGSLILSPINGRPLNQIVIGDKIMVRILHKDEKAIKLAKAFSVYNEEEDKIDPIKGRITFIEKQNEGGYKIYVIVAKGIYLHIEEEEETIKIKLDSSNKTDKNKISNKDNKKNKKIPLTIVAILGFFIITGIITALILL